MTTFNDLVEEVLLQVEGFVRHQDPLTALSSDITSSATSFTVLGYQDIHGLPTGLAEIGDELVFTQAYNTGTGQFTSVVRGMRGTTAAAHVAGEQVRVNPRFPRVQVKRAINDTIRSLYPRVPAVKTTEFTGLAAQSRYSLPTGALAVHSVAYSIPGPSGEWVECPQWRFVASPGGGSAGARSIDVNEFYPGRTVRVTYFAEPSPLSALSDNFATVSGLEEFTRDVVVLGAAYRLISMVELGRVSGSSADQSLMNRQDPIGSGTDAGNFLYGMFQSRLAECEARFGQMFPAQRHYTWR